MKVVVVGGGISGLAAAHRAVELARERAVPLELTLLEARDRLGGTIETERTGDFLVEAGPDSFISEKPWALALCRRLGVEHRLVRTDDRFRKTFVWFRGRLHPLPDGFQLLAPTRLWPFLASGLFSWRGKLRMGLDLVLPRGGSLIPGTPVADESLGSFVRRRLGHQALDRVAQPLVAGIYTADPNELSLAATMPRFLDVERRERSLILGLWRATRRATAAAREAGAQPAGRATGTSGARYSLFVTFRDGMGEFVDVLASRLPPGVVSLKQRVTGLTREGTGWSLTAGEGARLHADHVILATEPHVAARLLRPLDRGLAALLDGIVCASAATVSLGYRREEIPHRLDGFGFVVPRTEKRALLACTFSSVKYPGRAAEGLALLRGFVGGALDAGMLERSDDELVGAVRAELRDALGVAAEPRLVRVHRWPASMPQYHVGHLARIDAVARRLDDIPGITLAGGGYRGVGISDCVHGGETAAERALEG